MTPEEVLEIIAAAQPQNLPDRPPDRVQIWVRKGGSAWATHTVWQVDVKEWRTDGWEVRFSAPPPPQPAAVVEAAPPADTFVEEEEVVEPDPEPDPEPEIAPDVEVIEAVAFDPRTASLAEMREKWRELNAGKVPPPRAGKVWYQAQLS